jgi:hypothetical protein
MKTFLLFFIICFQGFSQSHNFSAKNNSITWENVFISNETNIAAVLAKHPRLTITTSAGKLHKGSAKKVKNTCPGTSAYMNEEMSFNFEIEESSGKYRVTVTDIKFTKNGKTSKAETYLLANGSVQTDEQAQKDIACLENYFNRTFTLTQLLKNKM